MQEGDAFVVGALFWAEVDQLKIEIEKALDF
jgi:hypothetical protein